MSLALRPRAEEITPPHDRDNQPVDYLVKITLTARPTDYAAPLQFHMSRQDLTESDRLPGLWRSPKAKDGWVVEHAFVNHREVFGTPSFSAQHVALHRPDSQGQKASEDDMAMSLFALPDYEDEAKRRLQNLMIQYLSEKRRAMQRRIRDLENYLLRQ